MRLNRWSALTMAALLLSSPVARAAEDKKPAKDSSSFGALQGGRRRRGPQATRRLARLRRQDRRRDRGQGQRPLGVRPAPARQGVRHARAVRRRRREAAGRGPRRLEAGPGRSPGAPEGQDEARLLPRQPHPRLRQGADASARSTRRRWRRWRWSSPEEAIDPAALFFHKAVCEYQLMLKDQAEAQHRPAARRRQRLARALPHGRGADALRHADVAGEGPRLDRPQDGQHPAPPRPRARRQEDPEGAEGSPRPPRRDDQGDREQAEAAAEGPGDPNGGDCPNGGRRPAVRPGHRHSRPARRRTPKAGPPTARARWTSRR